MDSPFAGVATIRVREDGAVRRDDVAGGDDVVRGMGPVVAFPRGAVQPGVGGELEVAAGLHFFLAEELATPLHVQDDPTSVSVAQEQVDHPPKLERPVSRLLGHFRLRPFDAGVEQVPEEAREAAFDAVRDVLAVAAAPALQQHGPLGLEQVAEVCVEPVAQRRVRERRPLRPPWVRVEEALEQPMGQIAVEQAPVVEVGGAPGPQVR